MKIQVTIEYVVDWTNYAFFGDYVDNNAILEQEKSVLVGLISEKVNPGQNIQIKEIK